MIDTARMMRMIVKTKITGERLEDHLEDLDGIGPTEVSALMALQEAGAIDGFRIDRSGDKTSLRIGKVHPDAAELVLLEESAIATELEKGLTEEDSHPDTETPDEPIDELEDDGRSHRSADG